VKVVYHKLVQKDLDDAWSYYEDASSGLGDLFFEEFLSVVEGVRKNPQRWRFANHGRRVALFKRFPFKLLYRGETEQVKVLVVRHQKRNPAFGDRRR